MSAFIDMILILVILIIDRCKGEQLLLNPSPFNNYTEQEKEINDTVSEVVFNDSSEILLDTTPTSWTSLPTMTTITSNTATPQKKLHPRHSFVTIPFPITGDPIMFPRSTSLTTRIVNPDGFITSQDAIEIAAATTGLTTCHCLPIQLCVNHTSFNEITTRIVTRPPPETICSFGQIYCCTTIAKPGCGIPNILPGVNPKEGQAHLGQYPWSAIILTTENFYVSGGVLIDSNHILTVAHRVVEFGNGANLKVRLGEWDISSEREPFPHLEIKVKRTVIHPQFEMNTLKNDISIITLSKSVPMLTNPFPQINSLCLPHPTMIFSGLRCKVAGWGKDQFHGSYQTIIKEVEVPVLSSYDCQAKLKKTRLGHSFVLDTNSFVCAGGEIGKDACTGDGGNALACMINGKYYVAGLTAGGIKCGTENVPGLYVNIVNYLSWIKEAIKMPDGIDPRSNN